MIKEKILFIYPKLFTFIKTEIDILSENFELIHLTQKWTSKLLLPINIIIQFFFLIIYINKVNIILISFGGYWSFLPSLIGKIMNKKVAIVVHGTDCVSFPEINYGNLRSPILSYIIKKSLQWSNIILPVSESLIYTENNYFSDKKLRFGYQYHLSDISTPSAVVHNGLIIDNWSKDNNISKDKSSFITVVSKGKLVLKGVDLVLEIASNFPKCYFYLAGVDNIDNLPSNVVCLGQLTPNELRIWYSKTQFYLQLSNTEGFGVSLCEAMLCECIPIVSNVNFLPQIIGKSGFVLKKRSNLLLTKIINLALNSDLEILMKKARKRIVSNFSSEIRKKRLIEELKKINA